MCTKCFRESSKLKTHETIHTGEKPFQCKVCKKCFRQKSQLMRHERIHIVEKPFQCKICKKSFDGSNARKELIVMRSHSNAIDAKVALKY